MQDLRHDSLIARIQHFYDLIDQIENDKENLLMVFPKDSLNSKEQLIGAINICEELKKEYYKIFDEFLYE